MRFLVATVLLLLPLSLHSSKAPRAQSSPGLPCGSQSQGLPDTYQSAVQAQLRPPEWKNSLVKIILGGDTKLALWTDGERYRLWTSTVESPEGSLGALLSRLNDSCALPADPVEAAALVKVKWESIDLSAEQFASLHREFVRAASQYVSRMQDRYSSMMASRLMTVHLEAEGYSIEYDNSYQHIVLEVWNMNDEPANPMLEWVHGLEKLAAASFRRRIWRQGP